MRSDESDNWIQKLTLAELDPDFENNTLQASSKNIVSDGKTFKCV